MTTLTLTKTKMIEGVWEGILTGGGTKGKAPMVKVTHLGRALDGLTVTPDASGEGWTLRVPVPVSTISDGMQTYLIMNEETEERLGAFAINAGEALGEDFRAELDLLRAELDMLKRAFRRHCVETA